MGAKATTAKAYLAKLPVDRRVAMTAVVARVRENLPEGYEEAFDFGMFVWQVPLSVYPDTYNKKPLMYAALASQKNHMALYLCNVYGLPKLRKELEAGFKAAGKKLDMGKSCLRFQKLEDLPLDVVGKSVAATPMSAYVEFSKKVANRKR